MDFYNANKFWYFKYHPVKSLKIMSSYKFSLFIILFSFVSCATTGQNKIATESPKDSSQTTTPESNIIEASIPATDVSFKLALIPAGSYQMGSPEGEVNREADEGPQMEVKVESFYMGVHEVTFDEFNIFREKELDKAPEGREDWNADAFARPSPPYEDPTFGMGKEGFPAVSMTQFSALQYCK